MINSYVRAADSERGEWAFRGGVSTPLGAEPQICKYEQLRERPGPFYVESDWTEEAKSAGDRRVEFASAARNDLAMPLRGQAGSGRRPSKEQQRHQQPAPGRARQRLRYRRL